MAVIQQRYISDSPPSEATSLSLAFQNPVRAGSLLVVALLSRNPPRRMTSVWDTLDNTWIEGFYVVNTDDITEHVTVSLWYCLASQAAGACTINAAGFPPPNNSSRYFIAEFDPVTAFDAADTNALSQTGLSPYPFGVSGGQSGPGLIVAMTSVYPEAGVFNLPDGEGYSWTPDGFAPLLLLTSMTQLWYRYTTEPIAFANVVTLLDSSSAGSLKAALGIIAFLTNETPPPPPGGEIDGDLTLCPPCVTADPGTVEAGGGDDGTPPWIQPSIGQQDVCAGGGLVPTQPDLVHSELWWGL